MTDRALVIGLDGMPRSLLHRLIDQGVVPCLAGVVAESGCAELVAPVPEISSTSWASFLTGVNPGRHGIYGFVDLEPGGYRTYFPNVADLQAPPLWEHAAAHGLDTVCLNVPGSYPAPAIQGTLVSGFVAPSLDKAVQPRWLVEPLRRLNYELDVEVGDVRADPAGFVARVRRSLSARTKAFRHLLGTRPWDVAIAVFTETDRLQHFLWRAVDDPADPLHEATMEFYREVDDAVAEVLACAPGVRPILVSDHGFGPATCQFYVNAWLRSRGWLAPVADTPKLSEVDGDSRVFALDPARFYVHRAGRFPRGTLSDAAADDLAAEVATALRALRWSGTDIGPEVDGPPVFDEVLSGAAAYHGPVSAQAPDIVAVPARGVQARGAWPATDLVAPDVLTGTHTRGDAVLSVPGGTVAGQADMTDVAPTVLAAVGVPAPDLDGRDVAAVRSTLETVSGGNS
ncbi:MAG TPA: alkaline phosphatase family protein [Actinophytocola sp.]|uniref:alkaline phosphatase family protein n=1 Tax=Actinophytocola sp. TaxID=1872138 RepID=UPI002DB5F306|nr:alkaline phosphatase family protein [Actinophytocola sp.]HEU5469383.1 alkaline phosphatase family protein [Actinophytocola sp.]